MTCELNKPKKTVKWMRDGKQLRANRDLKITMDSYTHQIVFTDLIVKDAGKITCTCGSVSTSATFKVTGKKLSWVLNSAPEISQENMSQVNATLQLKHSDLIKNLILESCAFKVFIFHTCYINCSRCHSLFVSHHCLKNEKGFI